MMWQYADHESIRGEANMRQWIKEHTELHDDILRACDAAHDKNVEKMRKESLIDEE